MHKIGTKHGAGDEVYEKDNTSSVFSLLRDERTMHILDYRGSVYCGGAIDNWLKKKGE